MDSNKPVVSIIIPVYNTARFLEKCLRSVMEQSWKKLEILVIDDGSTDTSGQILDRLAEEDQRIRPVHQANRGVAAARNKGLDLAQGKFITFVDGDDYIDKDYIRRFLCRQKETDADLLICGIDFVDEKGKVLKRIIPRRYKRFEHEEWPMRISAAGSHFYRHDLWKKCGLRFTEGERGEDMPISLYFAGMCEKIAVLSSSGYAYVQHPSSAMHRFKGLKNYSLPYKAMESCLLKVKNEGLKNDQEFYEIFILRILALCLFSLARGADASKKRELCRYIQHILKDYIPNYRKNKKTALFSNLDFPFVQKAAVRILILLSETKLLFPASLLLV